MISLGTIDPVAFPVLHVPGTLVHYAAFMMSRLIVLFCIIIIGRTFKCYIGNFFLNDKRGVRASLRVPRLIP